MTSEAQLTRSQNQDAVEIILDEDSIAKRRVPANEAETRPIARGNFLCHFCNKRFKSELLFMKHHCQQKRRQQELHSPLGQAAYGFYREWMRLRRFREQSSAAFLDSRFYRAFIKFAELVQSANIGQPEKYIQLMIESDIQPPLWCREAAYAIYLEWIDNQSDPLDEVQRSIEYLQDLAAKNNVELPEIFEKLGSQHILSLIRQRRLSPWFLFRSTKFGELLHKLSKDELKAFDLVVSSSFWAKKFQDNKQAVESIRLIVSGLEL